MINYSRILMIFLCICFANNLKAQEAKPLDAFVKREMANKNIKNYTLWQQVEKSNSPIVHASVKQANNLYLETATLSKLISEKAEVITLEIPFGTQTYTINLVRYDIFSSGFSVSTVNKGKEEVVSVNPGMHYRGVIEGMTGSYAAFSIFENEVYGIFSIPDVGNINILPNTTLAVSDPNAYISYNDADLLIEGFKCGSDDLPTLSKDATTTQNANRSTYSSCKEIEMYILIDYETYLNRNSSISNANNYITAIFNTVATLYRNEGIYISLKKLNINTSPDQYQSITGNSSEYLYQFGELTQNTLYGADLAHLVSSKSEGLGGVAWLDVLCQPFLPNYYYGPYAFSNFQASAAVQQFPVFSWNTECMTHEIGHNLSSPHTHWCGWVGGAIDGCYALESAQQGGGTLCNMPSPQYPPNGGTIMSYCHLVNGVGINLANGFGPQPGDKIREGVEASDCSDSYLPDNVLSAANTVINANRECSEDGMTYYWDDKNTATKEDDILALKIQKNNNQIGDLDQLGFEVKVETNNIYGTNQGTLLQFPTTLEFANDTNFAMNRYWKLTPITQPATNVDVYFPFDEQDMNDIKGSTNNVNTYKDLIIYNTRDGIDPDPSLGLLGSTNSNTTTSIYDNNMASLFTWKYETTNGSNFAHFKVKAFGGGSGFGTFGKTTSIKGNLDNSTQFMVYPNPAANEITIQLKNNQSGKIDLRLIDMLGKVILSETDVKDNHKINIAQYASGIYQIQLINKNGISKKNFVVK